MFSGSGASGLGRGAHGVTDNDAVEFGAATQNRKRIADEEAMRGCGEDAARAALRGISAAARRSVVPVLIRSSNRIAARPRTSPTKRSPLTTPPARCLSTKPARRLLAQRGGKRAAEAFGALRAANVGRDDGDLLVVQQPGEMLDEERHRFDVRGGNAKGIFEGGAVVDIECHHRVGAARLEHPRDVFRRDRIAALAALVLARIAEIREPPPSPGRLRHPSGRR